MKPDQRVVITGANSGIGAELAVLHAKRGDDIVMVNRSVERSRPVIDRIEHESPTVRVDVVRADLDDHDSIVAASQQLRGRGPIDIFYNNAGVLLGKPEMSRHGIEMHAEVNTVAPYLFVRLLHDVLKGGTVLTVSTGAVDNTGELDVAGLASPRTFKRLIGPYAQSKLAATALMAAFAREYPTIGFRTGEPGAVKTPMTAGEGMPKLLIPIRNLMFSAPDKAAARLHDVATNPEYAHPNGAFVLKGKIKALPGGAADPDVQASLLAWCHDVTGV